MKSFSNIYNLFCKSFEALLSPPFCLHCENILQEEQKNLCSLCLEEMEILKGKERCYFCFSEKEGHFCTAKDSFLARRGSVFEYEGAVTTLISLLKYKKEERMAKLLAPFLALQYTRLSYPKIDYIVPIPLSFKKIWKRGFNQSALLAEEMAKIVPIPVKNLLFRKSLGFSQVHATWNERKALDKNLFVLNKEISIEDKNILLIDDVMTTGTTLEKAAEVLAEGYPKAIYSLTVAVKNF